MINLRKTNIPTDKNDDFFILLKKPKFTLNKESLKYSIGLILALFLDIGNILQQQKKCNSKLQFINTAVYGEKFIFLIYNNNLFVCAYTTKIRFFKIFKYCFRFLCFVNQLFLVFFKR
jgi:hypothetical protein